MPNQPKTQHRPVRIVEEDWRDLGPAAERVGMTRAEVIRQFVAWYLGRPGAQLPIPVHDDEDTR